MLLDDEALGYLNEPAVELSTILYPLSGRHILLKEFLNVRM